uniref:Uncharacterized protein n=1 Tax=Anopheles farauti TaxID=69004 RepID=A0A182R0D8_9DIPT
MAHRASAVRELLPKHFLTATTNAEGAKELERSRFSARLHLSHAESPGRPKTGTGEYHPVPGSIVNIVKAKRLAASCHCNGRNPSVQTADAPAHISIGAFLLFLCAMFGYFGAAVVSKRSCPCFFEFP